MAAKIFALDYAHFLNSDPFSQLFLFFLLKLYSFQQGSKTNLIFRESGFAAPELAI